MVSFVNVLGISQYSIFWDEDLHFIIKWNLIGSLNLIFIKSMIKLINIISLTMYEKILIFIWTSCYYGFLFGRPWDYVLILVNKLYCYLFSSIRITFK